jgi:hypothetical protein
MEEWRYSSFILDLGTCWRSVVTLTPWFRSTRYQLDRRLGRSQSRFGHWGENNLILTGNRTRAVQPTARCYRNGCYILFLICVFKGVNNCPSVLETVGIRVPSRNIRIGYVSAANVVCNSVDIFINSRFYLKKLLV